MSHLEDSAKLDGGYAVARPRSARSLKHSKL
jgi:hypothetical protein